jgi:hypothetical protein
MENTFKKKSNQNYIKTQINMKDYTCNPKAAAAPMSLEKKAVGSSSDGMSPMSFSKKAMPGGESRPPMYRLENKKA